LQGLAGWAEKFTSFISIESPDLLLLEIAGSLRLFGGLHGLRRRIVSGLEKQGFDASLAIAPTPLAATWLARAGHRVCIVDGRKLTGTLSRLPLVCLGWPESVYESLNGMGISSIGECLRLPREGFARRFGACRLLELDRALGRLPDPRVSYRAPEQFCAEYELCEEQNDRELILHACHELLQKLERFLLTRQLSVQRIQFSFFHLKEAASSLTVGCIEANHRVARWFELLGIQFDRVTLAAPVIAIRLCGGHSQPFSVDTDTLRFTGAAENQQSLSMAHLIERLSARIGNELVHGVMTAAEHRPQYAWQAHPPLAQASQCPTMANSWYEERLRRPLWMLPEPRPLKVAQDRPWYQGQLQLVDGPERLETGWWDDDGIARDYFVAVNPQGICLWIFRNRSKDSVWYLHGIFG
jgi:protein ImuB